MTLFKARCKKRMDGNLQTGFDSLHAAGRFGDEVDLAEYHLHVLGKPELAVPVFERLAKQVIRTNNRWIINRAAGVLRDLWFRGGYFRRKNMSCRTSDGVSSYFYNGEYQNQDFVTWKKDYKEGAFYAEVEEEIYKIEHNLCGYPGNQCIEYLWTIDVLALLADEDASRRFRYHAYVFNKLGYNPTHPDKSFIQKLAELNYVEFGDEMTDQSNTWFHNVYLVNKIFTRAYAELDQLGKSGHEYARLEAIKIAEKLTQIYMKVVDVRVNIIDLVAGLNWFTIAVANGVEGAAEQERSYRERLKSRTDLDESRFSGLLRPISDETKHIFGKFFEQCESPPERILLHSLIRIAKLHASKDTLSGEVRVQLQVEIAPYRVDFLINDDLVVEVDGREYHDNSKSFESDRYRDQDLITAGYRVLRFPAKQIYLDGDAAARKITLACKSKINRIREQ